MIHVDHKVNVMDPDRKGIDEADLEFVLRNVPSDTDVINILYERNKKIKD